VRHGEAAVRALFHTHKRSRRRNRVAGGVAGAASAAEAHRQAGVAKPQSLSDAAPCTAVARAATPRGTHNQRTCLKARTQDATVHSSTAAAATALSTRRPMSVLRATDTREGRPRGQHIQN
jgi:hypothetical protein